jgi:excisionase family DNA binding protein
MNDYDLVCIMAAILRARQESFGSPDDNGRLPGIPSAIDEAIEIAARAKDLVLPSGVASSRRKQSAEQAACATQDLVKQLRAALGGLTQEKLARVMSVTLRTIARYEDPAEGPGVEGLVHLYSMAKHHGFTDLAAEFRNAALRMASVQQEAEFQKIAQRIDETDDGTPERKFCPQPVPGEPESTARGAMLKPDEALALIGTGQISRRAFYNALNRGEVPHQRLGRRILIPRHAFEQWLAGNRRKVS